MKSRPPYFTSLSGLFFQVLVEFEGMNTDVPQQGFCRRIRKRSGKPVICTKGTMLICRTQKWKTRLHRPRCSVFFGQRSKAPATRQLRNMKRGLKRKWLTPHTDDTKHSKMMEACHTSLGKKQIGMAITAAVKTRASKIAKKSMRIPRNTRNR